MTVIWKNTNSLHLHYGCCEICFKLLASTDLINLERWVIFNYLILQIIYTTDYEFIHDRTPWCIFCVADSFLLTGPH